MLTFQQKYGWSNNFKNQLFVDSSFVICNPP
eukprot:UN26369